jgi:dTDP-4-amino-4,6-dideoxygalactose transaminase
VWPPLPPGAPLSRGRRELPFPLGLPGCTLFAKGRHALYAGVKALGLSEGDGVLVPAYHHGSEIEALRRAGVELRFYKTTEDLAPDPDELQGLLDERVKALHLVHVLGFQQDSPAWRVWCDEHSLLLLEDAAQAWMGTDEEGLPLGARADLSIFCLYKSFGLPDGAALWCSARVEKPQPTGSGVLRVLRRMARWAMGRSAVAASAARRLSPERPFDPEADRSLDEPVRSPFRATTFLLPRVYEPSASERRRANYTFLLQHLPDVVPRPFDVLPGGAVPFAFPIEVDDGHAVAGRLKERGIEALAFWYQAHPSLPSVDFPAGSRRRQRTVVLPVHQELRGRDLQFIVSAVRAVL